jgi:hypothetical protein
MTTILQFPSGEEPRRARRPIAESETLGEIIIFPGVRIERWSHEGPSNFDDYAARKAAQRRKKS